jgi:hypothetical protein
MPAFGGFMNALGQAFGGYAQDEKGRSDDALRAQQLAMQQATQAREQQLANAQIGNYQSEANARTAAGASKANIDRVIQENWEKAISGDHQAQSRIVAADPSLAPHFMPKADTPNWTTQETPQGIVQVNPETGEVRQLSLGGKPLQPKASEQKEHWTPAGVDPATGQPLLLNTLSGETRVGGGLRAGSGILSPTAQRQKSVAESAREAADKMDEYENGIVAGTIKPVSPIKRGVAAMANTTSQGPIAQTMAGFAAKGLSGDDQDYADYSRYGRMMGEAAANMGTRYSNAKLSLESMLGSVQPGDERSRQLVKIIQRRRRSLLNEIPNPGASPVMPAPSLAPPTTAGPPSILSKYGITPTRP